MGRPAPVWRTVPEAARLVLTGRTRHTAAPVCLFVGVVLSAINQGAGLAGGHVGVGMFVRVAANFAVPYVVASVGYLAGHRLPDGSPSIQAADAPAETPVAFSRTVAEVGGDATPASASDPTDDPVT
jgi:hypothetical protein